MDPAPRIESHKGAFEDSKNVGDDFLVGIFVKTHLAILRKMAALFFEFILVKQETDRSVPV